MSDMCSDEDQANKAYAAWSNPNRHRKLILLCSAPLGDIFRVVSYLDNEEKDFIQSPRPDHIWPSICRVRNWLNFWPAELPEEDTSF